MAKQPFPIPGLVPIVSPSGQAKSPGALTMDDLAKLEEVRFVTEILDPATVNAQLLGIQAYLQTATNRGQNPELVGLQNFNLAVVNTEHDPANIGYVEAGPYLVAQHQSTLKYSMFVLNAPSGVGQDNYNYTTALSLVGLATADAPAESD